MSSGSNSDGYRVPVTTWSLTGFFSSHDAYAIFDARRRRVTVLALFRWLDSPEQIEATCLLLSEF
jgi:hypothetical protein